MNWFVLLLFGYVNALHLNATSPPAISVSTVAVIPRLLRLPFCLLHLTHHFPLFFWWEWELRLALPVSKLDYELHEHIALTAGAGWGTGGPQLSVLGRVQALSSGSFFGFVGIGASN